MTKISNFIGAAAAALLLLLLPSCSVPKLAQKQPEVPLPSVFSSTTAADTTAVALVDWKNYFDDPYLNRLIDTALANNKEMNILLQRIARSKNEIYARSGEYRPSIQLGAGSEVEKVGKYTRNGAVEEGLTIGDGQEFPEFLGNFQVGLMASWEIDVWKKLRNAQKVASLEYLASIEGRNFAMTSLVSEIAHSYYELLALDGQLNIIQQNIQLQQQALEAVRLLQQAGRSNLLAVRRFEAEIKKNQSEIALIQQEITGIENSINFLMGRFPQAIQRDTADFLQKTPQFLLNSAPSQMMANRPDIRRAELELQAAQLDIQVARAQFYPSFDLASGIGFQAFNPKFLLSTPESMLFSLVGDMTMPLVNRRGIEAQYQNANARQIEAAYEYEQAILKAYSEVATQFSNASNLQASLRQKQEQVDALTASIDISYSLFQSARADYLEVLLTQRDALEARLDLVDIKKAQYSSSVDLYRALGGGWK